MGLLGKVRFSLATIMMLVVTSAAAVALYTKVRTHVEMFAATGWKVDVPSLFLLAIALTAVALASWKEHSANQAMLQMTLACIGCLILIGICEAQYARMVRYWFQATFAATVSLPLLVRRYVKSELPRGPRRDFWKKTCEAAFFSFLNMLLVSLGGIYQAAVYLGGTEFLAKTGGL